MHNVCLCHFLNMSESAMVSFPGFSSPAASTEAPLEMLAACHIRIEHQCNTLQRLAEHLPGHGSDEQARQAATNIMRYFDTAAVDHHADEEDDLFPALLESVAGSDPVCIKALIDRLCHEHRQLEAAWRRLRKTLVQIAAGENAMLSGQEVDDFVNLYTGHIRCEEDELLPMAQRLLGQHHIEQIGQAMRIRRGIS